VEEGRDGLLLLGEEYKKWTQQLIGAEKGNAMCKEGVGEGMGDWPDGIWPIGHGHWHGYCLLLVGFGKLTKLANWSKGRGPIGVGGRKTAWKCQCQCGDGKPWWRR